MAAVATPHVHNPTNFTPVLPQNGLENCRRHSWHCLEECVRRMPPNRSFTCIESAQANARRRRPPLPPTSKKPQFLKQRSESQLTVTVLEQARDCDGEWPRPSTMFHAGKMLLKSLDFDALKFSSDDLVLFTLEIFNQIGVSERLGVTQSKLKKFILAARRCMYNNHYHNWAHAFDVLQTVFSYALVSGTMAKLSVVHRFSLIVAALCHDLEHPGVSNQFLVASRAELAIVYNDRSVLENHHAFRAFQLINSETIQLVSHFSKEDYIAFRKVVVSCILATDMARHGEYVAQLKQFLQNPDMEEDPLFSAKVLIKCADISNVTKPFPVAKKWAERITEELFLQGDKERGMGFPVTPTCDREKQNPSALQRGFGAFIAIPFFESVERYLPKLCGLSQRIRQNGDKW
eukprot:CAMPEP_0181301188 /NCGR_PEP_ID=MMETSP1101-20121128/7288_1 /TAXON_ID=46948 /ORGANISM="Rhodomonas abbreviata, Strain Caron Lab Isolate" /LENGTH=403 /DNA_ID=CAMNT_0023406471 /DNA_START=137 /DNA_END=1345 /DNA_ORIENTATION=-